MWMTHSSHPLISSILAGAFVLPLGSVVLSAAQTERATARPDLTGTVRDNAGHPIKNATVSIYASWPKGNEDLASQSTADCRKRTTTDADGRFTIKSLDPNALFRVLTVAQGFRPQLDWRIDPAARPLDVTLKPKPRGTLPDEQVRGQVVDSDGNPVAGALVTVLGVTRGGEWRSSSWPDIDSIVITDDAGEFVIRGEKPFMSCGFTVEARGFAKSGLQQEVPTGNTVHEVTLSKGAALRGRLLKDGKSVANAGVGITAVKANAYNGSFYATTDDQGRFSFAHIPANRNYYLFGIMKSLQNRGALPLWHVHVGSNGSVQEIGDLSLAPGYTVAGIVRWSDGKPAPPNCCLTLCLTVMTPPPVGQPPPSGPGSRQFLGLEDDLDSWVINPIGQGARFRFSGVPSGPVSIFIMGPPYYHVSSRNASADPAGWRLLGRVDGDITNLVFEIAHGQMRKKPTPVDCQALSQKPLRGVE